jgi:hypothetical protein
MAQERWLRAPEAKALGFVDEVVAGWDGKALAEMVTEWQAAGVLGQAALAELTAAEVEQEQGEPRGKG